MRQRILSCLIVVAVALLAGCETTPVDDDTEHPVITISEVTRGGIETLTSTDEDAVFRSPEPCPDGVQLVGTLWQVDGFPIELLVSASDPSGIEWLRVNSKAAEFSAPSDSAVRVGTRTVAGTEVRFARRDYPADDPRSPAVFSITVDAASDDAVVDIEGGASDSLGNDGYTFVIQAGTN
jgi:hypothetical protein